MLAHLAGRATSQAQASMEVDICTSSLCSSKHFTAHLNSGNLVLLDNSDPNDDDLRTYFTCPFCYVDTELSMLCYHLQEEHCFDVKNAVCPVCALSLGKDVVGHFKVYHSSSIKAQRCSQKSNFWNFYAGRSSLGVLKEESDSEHVDGLEPDPLLSPFLCSIQYPETKDEQSPDLCYSSEGISSVNVIESSNLSRIEKEDSEELRQRAAFCQQLIFSSIY